MLTYIIRRLLLLVPTLIGVTLVVFTVMAASPGGISAPLISQEIGMTPQERAAMSTYLDERYGLKDPLYKQYLRWLNKVSPIGFRRKEGATGPEATGGFGFKAPDLGHSFVKDRPVTDLIKTALPITLLLNVVSFPLVYAIAIGSGVYAARRRGTLFDTVSGFVKLGLWSIPTIWAGVLLIGFFSNREYFNWFPTNGLHDLRASAMPFLPAFTDHGFQRGWLLDAGYHLVLPIVCLSYGGFAYLSKLTRGAVLDSIVADYVRTARAKGVSERDVLWRHAFRNSLLPLITVAAYILPGLIAGSIVVETIFSINGMGKLAVEAVMMRDREVVLSVTLVGGLVGLVSYLLADVAYAIADPRVSYE